MTDEKYKIIVIEDNAKHLEDVKRIITPRENLVEAVYANNLDEAMVLLNSSKLEGILSDAHFPRIAGGEEAPCGIDIIDYAMNKRMPVTIVTSTYHHGKKTQPVCTRARNSGIELIDRYITPAEPLAYLSNSTYDLEATDKDWSLGLATLVFLMDRVRKGELKFSTITGGAADGKRIGMSSLLEGDTCGVYFDLPPYEKNALDEIKQRFVLEF